MVDRRVWLLSGVSVGHGICATVLAALLLRCIAFSTNAWESRIPKNGMTRRLQDCFELLDSTKGVQR
jgi:hypothetical protein